jgi:two-component system, OmpR family, phosphate regulon sensor histidine kinase PhoR
MLSQAAWYLLSYVGAAVLAGALVGWLLGSVWLGIALGLALTLAWQLLNLFWLDHWLRNRANSDPPDSSGLWGEVVSRVARLHRRKRFHKQRLLDVFRELRRSTAALPDGVVMLNQQWEIIWFNRMAAQLLGLKQKVDRGMHITNLWRDPDFGRYLQKGVFTEPLVLQRAVQGTDIHLSVQVISYGGNQFLMLVRDVSRQVALETMRKDFVANASHELRSPLTVMTGYLETLLQEPDVDPTLRAPLSEMQRQTLRMNAIVEDLLTLSRLDSLDDEPTGEDIDVPGLVATLRKDVLARSRHPDVQTLIETDVHLSGDPDEIYSAFSNLVDNAAKYTPVTGKICITWRSDADGGARFQVEDTGPGIAPEHLPRITERFYRVDAGRAREVGGTGLGLAIAKHVLQHHGATLEVSSTLGVGSVFACVFPARRVRSGKLAGAPALTRLAL